MSDITTLDSEELYLRHEQLAATRVLIVDEANDKILQVLDDVIAQYTKELADRYAKHLSEESGLPVTRKTIRKETI